MASGNDIDIEQPPPYHASAVKQWVKNIVRFSSQYNSTTWSADQAIGPPKVYPQHGDIHGAWAMGNIDKHQFLELEFDHAVKPTAINIYETFNPGAVIAVKAQNALGQMVTLWSTNRPTRAGSTSRIFTPTLADTHIKTNIIRLDVDCTAAGTWCEIDAVELVGIRDGAVMPADDTDYFSHMRNLVNNKTFSDVKFEMAGKSVFAHKAILATRSKFFAKMFGSEKQKADLKLPDVSYDAIIAILTFIYTNKLPLDCTVDTLVSICKVAPTFLLPEMRTSATYKLLAVLSCKTAVEVYLGVANDQSMGEVHSICKQFMADNLKEMSSDKSFSNLSQTDLVEIVQMATANMSINR